MPNSDDFIVRPMVERDRDAVIELCRASLGWREGDPNEAFFRWKHEENAFGRSPAWVAQSSEEQLVGLRVFMRWGFLENGVRRSAVRAVDTATHPAWQGRGIFTRLTLGALPELERGGTDFVFNTPNDKSRPGYLKMGWQTVGRVPMAVRPSSPGALVRMARSKAPAEMWSEPLAVGLDARDAFSDRSAVGELLARIPVDRRIGTERTADFLRWRYGFAPLRYRVLPVGDGVKSGVVVFRVRRRGEALEATIADVVVPPGRSARPALVRIARESGADYLLMAVPPVDARAARVRGPLRAAGLGFVAMPKIGPVVTWRALCHPRTPAIGDLGLTLGDIELF